MTNSAFFLWRTLPPLLPMVGAQSGGFRPPVLPRLAFLGKTGRLTLAYPGGLEPPTSGFGDRRSTD